MANYILAMGGDNGSNYYDTVEVFKVTANGVEKITDHGLSLSVARSDLAAASCGDYILAMGGDDSNNRYDTVDVFHVTSNGVEKITDHSLSLSVGRSYLAAASCGDYILALGGDDNNYDDTVDVFKVTANGVEQVTGHGLSLSVARSNLAAASCGEYILALGGDDSNNRYDTVDVFHVTSNGVEKITDHSLSLSVGRSYLAAASCGDYILAMGGDDSNYDDTVDVFKVTANGVEQVTGHGLSLSVARSNLAAASCGEYILALGGFPGSSSVVDVFKVTSNGVKKVTGHGLALSSPRQRLAAASCGDYILALGGRHEGVAVDTVDVFKRVVAQ